MTLYTQATTVTKQHIAKEFRRLRDFGLVVWNNNSQKKMPTGMIAATDFVVFGSQFMYAAEVKLGTDFFSDEQWETYIALMKFPYVCTMTITDDNWRDVFRDIMNGISPERAVLYKPLWNHFPKQLKATMKHLTEREIFIAVMTKFWGSSDKYAEIVYESRFHKKGGKKNGKNKDEDIQGDS